MYFPKKLIVNTINIYIKTLLIYHRELLKTATMKIPFVNEVLNLPNLLFIDIYEVLNFSYLTISLLQFQIPPNLCFYEINGIRLNFNRFLKN